ncbi:alpha/beta fold hydrolase [Roseivirga sp. E12]|uniref:alpha/beta fold hydrolase n=1 Tax=Roseivirga sp. E12 TaxID=2819237 RepID=UPI001ABC725B|nr:alpha/beta hydrolase [Roseivirga sp. E12]MBO3697971.1 alpha/beta hydrolase [Roseivirga sp. E12]
MKMIFLSFFLLTLFSYSFSQVETPPGQLIDVNGYSLHLILEGDGGLPVIMFHGAGDIALIWNLVLPKVAEFTTAIAVDQAGEGWSEHGHAIHMKQQAFDTYKALENAGIEGPYILVGHSLGGILARVFAEAYPEQVAGVVLVDATHPDVVLKVYKDGSSSWRRMRETATSSTIPEANKELLLDKPVLKSFQPSKEFGDMLAKFSEGDQERFQWFYNQRPYTYVPGRKSFESEVLQEVYENPLKYSFGDKPLIVITGGDKSFPEGDEHWSTESLRAHSIKLQKDLLKLSTDAEQIIAKKSGHQVHLDEPDLVVDAIRKVYKKLKSKD